MAKRYNQLLPLIDEVKPRVIVEVGVHKGIRARLMLKQALRHRSEVTYIGYDVFDTMGKKFQRQALNGKGMVAQVHAERLLETIKGATHSFVVGDTRETLHGHIVDADFAFIDGDHRLEAIRGDFAALRNCRVVVFDDYFREGGTGPMPNIDVYGANRIIESLDPSSVDILPISDDCRDGGVSHLAVVRKGSKDADRSGQAEGAG